MTKLQERETRQQERAGEQRACGPIDVVQEKGVRREQDGGRYDGKTDN